MNSKVYVGDAGRGTARRLERIEVAAAAAGFVVTDGSPRLIVAAPEPDVILGMPWDGSRSGPPALRLPRPMDGSPYLVVCDPETMEPLTPEQEFALDAAAWREGRGGTE